MPSRKRNRGRKSGSVRDKAEKRKMARLLEVGQPNQRVIDRREAFSFVTPTKGPDGRGGTIDQDICDGIGQLHALGLLDGHGHEPQQLRDAGRRWGELYWNNNPETNPKVGKLEPASRSTGGKPGLNPRDYGEFRALDDALDEAFERGAVMSLVVDPWWSDEIVPWASGLIAEELLKRGRYPSSLAILPTENDRQLLAACVRGLLKLVDVRLPARRAA